MQIPHAMSHPEIQIRTPEEARLYEACQEFETAMVRSLLKQSLQQASEGWHDSSEEKSETGYEEMTWEHLVTHLGQQGLLGLAPVIYRDLQNHQTQPPGA